MIKCKVCNNKKLTKLEFKETYYYCEKCELIFIDEEDIIDGNEEKERYAQHDNNHQNVGYVKMFKRFIKILIQPYIDINTIEKALDFGCGPGPVLADLLKKNGLEVDIYDPFFYPEKVFMKKKYDLITSTEVFEHLKNPLKEIETLLDCLKKGGYLALMTSYHPGTEEFEEWWYRWDPTHVTFYNIKTFKEIADKYSLEIVFTDGEKYCLLKKG